MQRVCSAKKIIVNSEGKNKTKQSCLSLIKLSKMFPVKKIVKRCLYMLLSLMILEFFLYYTSKYKIEYFLKKLKEANVNSREKISWENETQITMDAKRVGPGEQGLPFELTDPIEIRENQKMFVVEGFYVLVSDKISLSRALPDKRPKA